MRPKNFLIPAKFLLILLFCLAVNFTTTAQAQILDAIKDAITGETKKSKTSETPEENTAKDINTAAKKQFYTADILVKSYDRQKQAHINNCFDKEGFAMKSDWTDKKTGKNKVAYTDSEGYFTAYNDSKERYEKTKLLALGGMGMVGPSAMLSAYKLPVDTYWATSEKYEKKGVKVGTFMFAGFAFIYQPEDFRNDNYSESKTACRGKSACTRFGINEKGYDGSYILFDDQDRLAEINVRIKDDPQFGSGEGKIEYFYNETCNFTIPPAVEIKMPGQDIFNLD